MSQEFHLQPASRKAGSERFSAGSSDLGFDLLSFWQWSASDLVSNSTRGVLAEYIVARALGIPTTVRDEWAPVDLVTTEGVKIQVKSAACLQSWYQRALSRIVFSTKATRSWDASTGKWGENATVESDIYVFAVLAHKNKETLNPLDVSQWSFYVGSRDQVCGKRTISLQGLEKLGICDVAYAELRNEVLRCCAELGLPKGG